MNYFYGEYWAQGVVRGRMGTANHLSVPNQVFPASDGGVVIIAPSDDMWKRCAGALDAAKLDRPEWRTTVDRQRHRAELIEAISAITRTMTSDALIERLGHARVNVANVNDIGQAAMHPQLAAIGAVLELAGDAGPIKAVASPFALEGAPTADDRPPPVLGTHTNEVLADLGFSPADIDALRSEVAFGAVRAH
jgi:crotonobetainyl-CoA:carnitine CoA-transferase CaiB-like acyl-CoA transferase